MLIRTDIYHAPVQNFIQPIIQAAISQQLNILPQLHSIYLYGSCAQGTAVMGKSDMDLSIVINSPLTYPQQHELEILEQQLAQQFAEITKVDFDFGLLDEVLDSQQFYRWGYWLKHCCQCIYGQDLSMQFPIYRASREIALQLNQGYAQQVQTDLSKLQQTNDPQQRCILKNQICKRLIRASHIKRPAQASDWPYQLADYLTLFSQWQPQQTAQLQGFYHFLANDVFSTAALSQQVNAFLSFLEQH